MCKSHSKKYIFKRLYTKLDKEVFEIKKVKDKEKVHRNM